MKTFETLEAASSHCWTTPLRPRWRRSGYSNWADVKSVPITFDRQICPRVFC